MAPTQIVQWIRATYPRPKVDDDWLDACCSWISDELNIDPIVQKEEFLTNVENQLLESNLCDSMVSGTGLPDNAPAMNDEHLLGQPILVEIIAIDEIGHSAFNLQNTRQTRIEREDLAGLAIQEGVEDDEGPIPRYPHTMLKFHISDGNVTLPAIEYRTIPDIKLGETPLGYKLLLKNVLIRRGIAFLEPGNIEVKGHQTPDRDEHRDRDFVHGLCARLGKPVPLDEDTGGEEGTQGMQANQHNTDRARTPLSLQRNPSVIRSPLQEIPEPPEPELVSMQLEEDADLPRKRRVPSRTLPSESGSLASSTLNTASSTLVSSRFFAGSERPSTPSAMGTSTQSLAHVLSPVKGPLIDLDDDSDEAGAADVYSLTQAPRTTRIDNSSVAQLTRTVRADTTFEEFDFPSDDALDAAFLDEITKVEEEALGSNPESSNRANTNTTSRLTQNVATSSSDVSTAMSLGRGNRQFHTRPPPSSQAQAHTERQTTPVPTSVITIDDDEEDDKENVPVPQRRVRRRVVDRVIDLSD